MISDIPVRDANEMLLYLALLTLKGLESGNGTFCHVSDLRQSSGSTVQQKVAQKTWKSWESLNQQTSDELERPPTTQTPRPPRDPGSAVGR